MKLPTPKGFNSDDAGFTLAELLMVMFVSALLGGLLLSTLFVTKKSSDSTVAVADMNGEARALLDRLSGDLRQALPVWTLTSGTEVETPAITAVQNPYPGGSATAVTSITFNADFNGDGCVAGVASDGCSPAKAVDANDPETETFCWDASTQLVYLIAGGVTTGTCTPANGGASQPLLSGKVSNLQIAYDSNAYLYDSNNDGTTTWQELDAQAPPVGNGDGQLDMPELTRIDAVRITATASEDGHVLSYETLVSLRNIS